MEVDPAAQHAPSVVAGYDILLPVGTGGMGTVFLAKREVVTGVRRRFAVKLIHPHVRADAALADELLREARLAASIHHPNVVSLVEAGEENGWVYLVMDYVEGDSLIGLIRAAKKMDVHLPMRVAGRIMVDALIGLHAAHEATDEQGRSLGIIHRDFSPQNILVGLDGVSRLTDFGVAKAMEQVSTTASGTIKGKAGYMAPEQIAGLPLDRRVDVWAAGVVLWEALTMRRLFSAQNDAQRLMQIVSGDPVPRVSERVPNIPPEIDEMTATALSKPPQGRFATAADMRSALEHAFRGVGLAGNDEVSAELERLLGDELRVRRVRAQEMSQLRRRMSDVTKEAAERAALAGAATPSATERALGEPTAVTSTRDTTTAHQAPRPAGRGRTVMVGVAGLLVAGAGAWMVSTRVTPPAEVDSSPRAEATAAAEAPATPSATSGPASPSPAPDPTAAPAPSLMQIVANAPVAQVELGGVAIPLASPGERVAIPVPAHATGAQKLVAIAVDGRVVEVEVTPSLEEVSVTFAPKPAPIAGPGPGHASPRPPPMAPPPTAPPPATGDRPIIIPSNRSK